MDLNVDPTVSNGANDRIHPINLSVSPEEALPGKSVSAPSLEQQGAVESWAGSRLEGQEHQKPLCCPAVGVSSWNSGWEGGHTSQKFISDLQEQPSSSRALGSLPAVSGKRGDKSQSGRGWRAAEYP